ncbi:MAG: hypothetical protein HQK60_18070 [Deltaproteobacteria bacterium]|nr:hypothetical protein [Deltaproteobacteria bacterium]
MKLYLVNTIGIRAYCSDLIESPGLVGLAYLISICGFQTTVKGIVANLLEKTHISINIEGDYHYVFRADLNYKVQIKKLPSGMCHAILFSKLALPGYSEEGGGNSFVVFTNHQTELLNLFYRHLDHKTDIPLHPSWAGWLWSVFEQNGWLTELTTLAGDYKGYLFDFEPSRLREMVADAIRQDLPAVTSCFRKGGIG